ncbi:MAG TPA: hypothetical protein VGG33_17630, partial [Polyangia bacterium]
MFWTSLARQRQSSLFVAKENEPGSVRVIASGTLGSLAAAPNFVVAGFFDESQTVKVVRVPRGTTAVVPFVEIPAAQHPFELVADDVRIYARDGGSIGAWDHSGL